MKLFIALFSLLLVLAEQPTFASSAPECVNEGLVREVLAQYPIYRLSRDRQGWVREAIPDPCATGSLALKIVKGILFLRQVPPLGESDFSTGILREGAESFFRKRISRINLVPNGFGSCAEGGAALAFVMLNGERTMYACPALQNVSSQVLMSWVLVHEARHVDGYRHATCSTGPFRGMGGCDPDFDWQGSYGVGAGFVAALSRAETVHEAVRQEARAQAVEDFLIRFNRKPLGLKEAALLQSDEGGVLFFDGKNRTSFLESVWRGGLLVLRSSLPTLFDAAGPSVKSYEYSLELKDTAGAFAERYRKDFTDEQRARLLDVHYGKVYSCCLFPERLLCGGGSEPDVEIPLEAFRPRVFLQSDGSSFLRKGVLYIAAEDGYLYALPGAYKELQKAKDTSLRKTSKPYHLAGQAMIGSLELGLSPEGELGSISKGRWQLYPDFSGERFRKILGPFLWSRKLEEL